MKKHFWLFGLVIYSCSVNKTVIRENTIVLESFSDGTADKYASTISKGDLHTHLSILASDEYEGRETARPGQKKAANYIANQFKEFGISTGNGSSYFQTFSVDAKNPANVSLQINDLEYELLKDFYYIGNLMDSVYNNVELVYAGYGIEEGDYSDYSIVDVEGKIALIKEGNPGNNPDIKIGWRDKYKAAIANGAVGVITIKDDFQTGVERIKEYILDGNMQMHNQGRRKGDLYPNIFISSTVANKFFDGKKLAESKVTINVDIQEELTSDNVLGFIEGTELKDEVIVITAHYDHLGYDNGEICNGADDDGSGTVSVIEIAEAFQKAKEDGNGPKRSILFMTVSGEEKGLWGSKYYTDNPVYPLKNTVVDLNIDMVGRRDEHHLTDEYVYLIGSDRISMDLHFISEKVNEKFIQFALDYTYNEESDPNQFYYRSDHYNFAKNNIPVIFYFSGVHEDYHKPTDDVEKINFDKLEKTAKLVFYTAWEIANRVDKLEKNAK